MVQAVSTIRAVLFLDITSTYFELDEPVTPVARDQRGVPVPDADRATA